MHKLISYFRYFHCFFLLSILVIGLSSLTVWAGYYGAENDPAYAVDQDGDGQIDAYVYRSGNNNALLQDVSPASYALLAADTPKHVPTDPVPSNYDPNYSDNTAAFYPTYGEWVYSERSNNEVSLVAYLGNATAVVIPSELGGRTVVSLENDLFSREAPFLVGGGYSVSASRAKNVISVTIPDTVEQVNSFLSYTNVTSIHLPDSVNFVGSLGHSSRLIEITVSPDNPYFTVVDGVLYDKLVSTLMAYPPYKPDVVYTLPDTLASISHFGAFANVQFIEAFSVEDTSLSFSVIDGVLFDKNKTQLLRYPMFKSDEVYETPTGVPTIAADAFNDNRKLKHLVLSEGVENMVYVNSVNALLSVHLPSTVTKSVGYGTNNDHNVYYQMFSLTSITVAADNPVLCAEDGVLYNKDKTVLYAYPMVKEGREYYMPGTVKTVVESAFWNNRNLERIIIPASLTDFNEGTVTKHRLEEFVVDEGNQTYTAIDGVLYTKDGRVLVHYPGGAKRDAYMVPDEAEYINMINCTSLQSITLPPNLTAMSVPSSTFTKSSFTLYGKNDYARRWASYFKIPFTRLEVSVDEISDALDNAQAAIDALKEATRNTASWGDLAQITNIIEDFDDMSEADKALLSSEQITELETLRSIIAAINHTDGAVSTSDAPWNIRLEAAQRNPQDAGYDLAQSMLGSGGVITALFDIKITKAGVAHVLSADEEMTITITGNFDGYTVETIRIFHIKSDYTTEYIVPTQVTPTSLTFKVTSFSLFALVTALAIEPEEPEEPEEPYWAGRIVNKNQGRVQYGEPVEGVRIEGAFSPNGGTLSYEWWWSSYDRAETFGYIGTTYGEDTAMPSAGLTEPGMYKIEAKVTNTKDGADSEPVWLSTNVWIVSTPVITSMTAATDVVTTGQPVHLNATATTQDQATMFYLWHRTNLDTGEFKCLDGSNGWYDSNVYTDNEVLAPGQYRYELLIFSVRFIFTDVPEELGSITGNGYANPSGVSDGSFSYSEDGSFYYGGTWSTATNQFITVTVVAE